MTSTPIVRRGPRPLLLVRAPCNLGLRPLRPGHEPGTWQAPDALTRAGLADSLAPARVLDLPRPRYGTEPQPGTRLLNGQSVRAFNLLLADAVASAVAAGERVLILGGDCSLLLGALAGARRVTPLSLVHVDGHSDFRHPGNYDPQATLSAVGGMALALATGRGETLLTDWPGVPTPLVPDAQVIQIGEREGRNDDFPWPDIAQTAIDRIDVFAARQAGMTSVLERIAGTLDRTAWPFWLHLDIDVLDQTVMPAVDSPGSPGVDPPELVMLLRGLLASTRCAGMTITIFDPDLDPDGIHARRVASLLRDAFA